MLKLVCRRCVVQRSKLTESAINSPLSATSFSLLRRFCHVHPPSSPPWPQAVRSAAPVTQNCSDDGQGRHVTPTLAQRITASCPRASQPYLQLMRLDRPIGSWLLFWPCGWALVQAQSPAHLPDMHLVCVFAAGALVMRAAGCTVNDLWDRKIDRQVERTRSRPLASGRVSVTAALQLLSVQLAAGGWLLLQLNWSAVQLGVASLALVALYPLAKRFTYWPQLVLGVTFNLGVPMAYAAVYGDQWSSVWHQMAPLYVAAVCWTLVYDTIYAHQDKHDDLQLGIGSTALLFGQATPRWLAVFAGGMCSALLLAGVTANQSWPYYLSVTCVAAHLARQIVSMDGNDATDCGCKFRSNRWLGLVLFVGILCGRLMTDSPANSCSPAAAITDSARPLSVTSPVPELCMCDTVCAATITSQPGMRDTDRQTNS